MKFMFSQLNTPIVFEEGEVQSLIIENQKVFRNLISDIDSQIKSCSGDSVLSINNKPVPMGKHVELLTEFVPFDLNQKKFLTKIITELDNNAVDETNYCTTQELLAIIEKYIQDLAFSLPVDIELTKLSFSSLIKAVGIMIIDDNNHPAGMLIDYLKMASEQEKQKLFITVNLRSYFTDEELNLFLATVYANKYQILMIESTERQKLLRESRRIIDIDLCEI